MNFLSKNEAFIKIVNIFIDRKLSHKQKQCCVLVILNQHADVGLS